MIFGTREARPSALRRLVAKAAARELVAFVVPGPDVARARGVDLEAAGLRVADTPRHAGVLVLVGELPAGMKKAAAVAYAQMPRPRAVLAVGAGDVSPLPEPDVSVSLEGGDLDAGAEELRRVIADGAFSEEADDFDVDEIRTRTEYVCPMHPEFTGDEPGSCPKCGMDLVPREAAGHHGRDHTGHEGMDHGVGHGDAGRALDEAASHGGRAEAGHEKDPGEDPGSHGGSDHEGGHHDEGSGEHGDHGGAGHEGHGEDRDGHDHMEHGEHEGTDGMDHGGHERGGHGHHMDHGEMGFMSMVAMTQGTPRSSDGLQMEWIDAPFGPLFPGLPGGLSLAFTLDGDAVAGAGATPGVEGWGPEGLADGPGWGFADRLALLDPFSPVAYRVLALRALEDAADAEADEGAAFGRVGALERERAVSHLGWLSRFGHLLGYPWLEGRAGRLQLALLRAADAGEVARLDAEVGKLLRWVVRTPLLSCRLKGIGTLPEDAQASGPVARAGGLVEDARAEEEVYRSLDFEPVVRDGDDALARLRVRLAEIERSLALVRRAGCVSVPEAVLEGDGAGAGAATVETPRGTARLRLTLENGVVSGLSLDTPSTRHMGLIRAVVEQRELADALVGVASLDLSPWEVVR